MTLIAAFEAHGGIAMLGDLLLTSERPAPHRAVVPARFERQLDPADFGRRYPVGMCQKLVQINDGLVVAWAGNLHQAGRAISRIRAICDGPDDFDAARAFLLDIPEDPEFPDLSIIALRAASGFEAEVVTTRVPVGQDAPMLRVAGSGTDAAVQRLLPLVGSLQHDGDDPAARFFMPALTALSWCGMNNIIDRRENQNLSQWFGAGYEVAALGGGRLTKLDNIFSVLLHVRDAPGGGYNMALEGHIIHQHYVGPTLILAYYGAVGDERSHWHIVNAPDQTDLANVQPKQPDRPDWISYTWIYRGRMFSNGTAPGDESAIYFENGRACFRSDLLTYAFDMARRGVIDPL